MADHGKNFALLPILIIAATFISAASADAGGHLGGRGRRILVGDNCGTGWAFGCDFQRWTAVTRLDVGDVVVFQWKSAHNLVQFSSEATWNSCNTSTPSAPISFISPQQGTPAFPIGAEFPAGTYEIVVTKDPQWFACTAGRVVNSSTLALGAGHCNAGMKVKIQAGISGKEVKELYWVEGSAIAPFNNYTSLFASLSFKIQDSIYLKWYGSAHSVFEFNNKASFDTCNITDTQSLAITARGMFSLQTTGKVRYIGCNVGVGAHCNNGMKFVFPPGKL